MFTIVFRPQRFFVKERLLILISKLAEYIQCGGSIFSSSEISTIYFGNRDFFHPEYIIFCLCLCILYAGMGGLSLF